jgi:hypothetical protein
VCRVMARLSSRVGFDTCARFIVAVVFDACLRRKAWG